MRTAVLAAVTVALSALPAAAQAPEEALRVVRSEVVSGPSPYDDCADGRLRGAEASPALAVTHRPSSLAVVWQQDASHDAGGEITTVSSGIGSNAGDVGAAECAPGARPGETASAPSLAVGADGTQWAATTVGGQDRWQVVVARRQPRGSWQPGVVAEFDPATVPTSYLPPTVAVDPADPAVVHVAYARNHFPAGTLAVHRVTRDGGATWSAEHVIGAGATVLAYDFAEQLAVLPGGRLLAVSTEVDQADLAVLAPDYVDNGDLTQAPVVHRARVSDDGGQTWSLPVDVLRLDNGGVRDREPKPEGPRTALRSLVRPSVALAPDGAVHVAGESVAGDGTRTALLVATSRDSGESWTSEVAATTPGLGLAASVAVDGTGRLAVSWLSLSRDRPADDELTAEWRIASQRGARWMPAQPLSQPFDLRLLAPVFVGDQGALVGLRRGFAAATVVGTGRAGDPSNVVLSVLSP